MRRRNWFIILWFGMLAGCMPGPARRPGPVVVPEAEPGGAETIPGPALAGPLAQPVVPPPTMPEPPLLLNEPEPPPPPEPLAAAEPMIQQVSAAAAVEANDPPLVLALRCFLDHRPDDAVRHLRGLAPLNQELLLQLMALSGMLTKGDLTQASPAEVGQAVEQLQQVLQQLQARAPLVISAMCFCRSIRQFGDYEPLPPQHDFRPGERVQLYVELRNFTVERRGPVYRTQLSSTMEVRDFHQQLVWRQDFPEEASHPDRSRTPRQDYFANFLFGVPDIPPGKYTLWLLVRDGGKTGHEPARRSLDFRVAPPAVRTP